MRIAIQEAAMPVQTRPPILVKRYATDRLYDTVAGRYVTVADLKKWTASDVSFVVLDVETGEDITPVLLA
jgi:polyhydroxyalkanoate synthesis regulator protein